MSRRCLPQHFKRGGLPKKPYDSEREARLAGRKHRQQHYLCDFCNKWHTGGRLDKKKKA